MNDLDLQAALHRDADLVGEPSPDLLQQLGHRRQRQRRQRTGIAAAVLGVVVIAAGIPLGGALLSSADGGLATAPTSAVTTQAPSPSTEAPTIVPPAPSLAPQPPVTTAAEPDPAPPSAPTSSAPESPPAPAALVLGPYGLGPLELGMSRDEAEAAGLVTPFVNDPISDRCLWRSRLTGAPADEGRIFHSEDLGVATIDARAGVRTPEGVGLGSSLSAVQDAYPGIETSAFEFTHRLYVTAPGNDEAVYRFAFTDAVVTELTLQLGDQNCYE